MSDLEKKRAHLAILERIHQDYPDMNLGKAITDFKQEIELLEVGVDRWSDAKRWMRSNASHIMTRYVQFLESRLRGYDEQ